MWEALPWEALPREALPPWEALPWDALPRDTRKDGTPGRKGNVFRRNVNADALQKSIDT